MRMAVRMEMGSSTSTYSTFWDLNMVSLETAPTPVCDMEVWEIFSVADSDSDYFMPVAEEFSLGLELVLVSPFFFFFLVTSLSLAVTDSILTCEASASASIRHLGSFILSTMVLLILL